MTLTVVWLPGRQLTPLGCLAYMTPFHSPSTRKKGLLELDTWLQGGRGRGGASRVQLYSVVVHRLTVGGV